MLQDKIYRNVPEYYHWMYLDGYTPEQIFYAKRKQMLKNYNEQKRKYIVEHEAEVVVLKSLEELFKGFK